MKVFLVLAACVVAVSAGKTHYGQGPALFGAVRGPIAHGPIGHAPLAAAAVSTGTSSQFRSEDNYGNFNFGYDESHATGSTSRREEQTNGVRRGSYSLSDADGRRRVVNYIADAAGFRASIQTNEPGVEPKDPADTLINKEGHELAVAPAPIAHAVAAPLPAPEFAPLAAPIAHGPLAAPQYAPAPIRSYYPALAPIAHAAPVVIEEPTPRAFSYSFGSTHLAPAYAPLQAHLPAGPAPIYQQQQQILDY